MRSAGGRDVASKLSDQRLRRVRPAQTSMLTVKLAHEATAEVVDDLQGLDELYRLASQNALRVAFLAKGRPTWIAR